MNNNQSIAVYLRTETGKLFHMREEENSFDIEISKLPDLDYRGVLS